MKIDSMNIAKNKSKRKVKHSTNANTIKGKNRKKEILEVSKEILLKNDYSQFTLRNIATEASLHLSNVQYYFPTKEDLIRALVIDIGEAYTQEVDDLFVKTQAAPVTKFLSMMDYLVEQVKDPQTRRFFIQLWALLSTSGSNGTELLSNLYLVDIMNIERVMEELNPLLTDGARRQRATMIAAMMEGMILMLDDADTALARGEENIEKKLKKLALRIALDP